MVLAEDFTPPLPSAMNTSPTISPATAGTSASTTCPSMTTTPE